MVLVQRFLHLLAVLVGELVVLALATELPEDRGREEIANAVITDARIGEGLVFQRLLRSEPRPVVALPSADVGVLAGLVGEALQVLGRRVRGDL